MTAASELTKTLTGALAAFVKERPGLDPRDYAGFSRAYERDRRMATNDRTDALRLIDYIDGKNTLHGDFPAHLIFRAADRAYAGRLNIERVTRNDGEAWVQIDYTPGQMGSLEYREAVAAVAAEAILLYWREIEGNNLTGEGIHTKARNLFGRRIARNFF